MIWVVGSKGMLGSELRDSLSAASIDFIGTDMEVSILELDALFKFAETQKPDWIVNCSAYTAVDQAEDESELAYKINKHGVQNLATVASRLNIPIIHFSTDYVFDGNSESPLDENAETSPIGVYGHSKLEGEHAIREICPAHVIIRTAWLYGRHGNNFVFTMLRLMNQLETIKVVNDQIGSPTWARDLADLVVTFLKSDALKYGTYHFSNEGKCSWFEFAGEIYQQGKSLGLIESDCDIRACDSSEFPTKAKRPSFSLLSKSKVKTELGVVPPDWEVSLSNFLAGIELTDVIPGNK